MASDGKELRGKLVTVIGGTGFFGKHLAQELLSRGARLRIASRHPERAFRLKALANLGQVQFVRCDVTKPASLAAVIAGADAVVNLVGAFAGNLDAVQGQGAGRIAAPGPTSPAAKTGSGVALTSCRTPATGESTRVTRADPRWRSRWCRRRGRRPPGRRCPHA